MFITLLLLIRPFINAWHKQNRPIGRPIQTIKHTYLYALKKVNLIPEDDMSGKLNVWTEKAKNEKDWEEMRLSLLKHITGELHVNYMNTSYNNLDSNYHNNDNWTNPVSLYQ